MKTTFKSKWLSRLLCLVLVAAAALATAGCGETREEPQTAAEDATVLGEGEMTASVVLLEDGAELGEGETEFLFTITDLDGKETCVTIHTDKATVGEALQELGLIVGEEGPYGLYVKTVNGETADYEKDGAYWAFYINGEYAMTGVDYTAPEAGTTYGFHVEKAEG